MISAAPATDEVFTLAEGPVWDAPRRRLLWVDILGSTLLEGVVEGPRIDVRHRYDFDCMVSAVAVNAQGALLVAAEQNLVVIQPDGSRVVGPRIVPVGEHRRLNDGGNDPSGRFVVGTLSLNGDSEREVLVRLEIDGSLTEMDCDLTLSNGVAWSTHRRTMYSVDTGRQVIYARDYDPHTGSIGPRYKHVRITDGYPDGLALDIDDHLWVAIWGKGEVRRLSPDGEVVDRIAVPAPHTTSVAFAGEDLRTLIITTATAELSDEQIEEFPASGRLFTAYVDIPGAPITPWSGSTFS